ncbi:MAG: arginase family protein [Pirellulales bacterium]|nr:arginase family protein [Pirellulales bacterium]
MESFPENQFLPTPSATFDAADVVMVQLPLEKTVSYGTGTSGGPRAILQSSSQIELFEEETGLDFQYSPKIHVAPPLRFDPTESLETALGQIRDFMRPLRGRFVFGLGGEHSLTYGTLTGLCDDLRDVTVVQLDAHADLADTLGGLKWSHGTVMRRLWERGCRFLQIGIRSLSREEFEVASTSDRITLYYAHEFPRRWPEVLESLRRLEGKVYFTLDVDGLDPSLIPSTGTPQPNGLSWRQTMDVIRGVAENPKIDWFSTDMVEFVPSPHPPGCDLVAARLAMKVLAYRQIGLRNRGK